MESVLIVHVPHSSLYIPPRYRGLFLLPPERLEAECRRMILVMLAGYIC